MCTECVPPLTRPWEIRPAGTDLSILTRSNPHGILVSLTELGLDSVTFERYSDIKTIHQYRFYATRYKNRANRAEILKSLSPLEYEALQRLANTLLNGLRSGPRAPVTFFFYGNSRIGITKISSEAIEIWKTMPTNERIELTPDSARRIVRGLEGTDPFLIQAALLAECIWKRHQPLSQLVLGLDRLGHG